MNARTYNGFSCGYIKLDRSFFSIIVPADDSFAVADEASAHHQYRSLFSGRLNQECSERGTDARLVTGITVIEFNPVEGWSKDVTLDFADWSEPDSGHGIPTDAELRREYNSRVL